MRNKLGVLCMTAGVLLILASLGLFVANRVEERHAAEAVESLMPEIVRQIEENLRADAATTAPVPEPIEPAPETTTVPARPAPVITAAPTTTAPAPETTAPSMPVSYIGGHGYIGYLNLPELGLQLPIMDDWDYDRLKLTPCRFSGAAEADNLVLAGHDYARHFGGLEELSLEDPVQFTDMHGRTYSYVVTEIDVLAANALEEMTAGEHDLTLFTCTYDGKNRFTVRCDRVS